MQADPQLTPHFRLSEFTQSQEAARRVIGNEPLGYQVEYLSRLSQTLEVVRDALDGAPILISSGFRSPLLNAAVGGAITSAHLYGRAADFTAPRFGNPRQVCERLVERAIVFDQLILEGTWVHLGIASNLELPRCEVLTAHFVPGARTRYSVGLN